MTVGRVIGPTFGMPGMPLLYKAAKLTPAQRDEIGFRRMEGEPVRSLAAEYGVNTDLIRTCVPKERT